MNLLLVGTVTSDSLSRQLVSRNIKPGPAEIVQRYLISGLNNCRLDSVEVVAAPRIPSFPRTKIQRIKQEEWQYESVQIHSVGFNNLEGIGFVDRKNKIVKAALEWADRHKSQPKTVLVYSLHSPFLLAARAIKHKYPTTVIAAIIPDLPQYMSAPKGIRKIAKKIDMRRIDQLLGYVDKYVLYTKHMARYFNLPDDRWIVMEGLMDTKKIVTKQSHKKHSCPVCLYAGRLESIYAVDKLIKSFESVPEAELHLYGSPQEASKLKNLIDTVENVKFMGTLSQEGVFQKMRDADLLLNPRPTNIELAKYSCPSKTFEYMASGTPVLMTKLPGLPEEYYPYLYFFDEESVEGFSKTILHVLSISEKERYEKGRMAQEFLKNCKDSGTQVNRVIEFLLNDKIV